MQRKSKLFIGLSVFGLVLALGLGLYAQQQSAAQKAAAKAGMDLMKAKAELAKEGKYACCIEYKDMKTGKGMGGCNLCAVMMGGCPCASNLKGGKPVCPECFGGWHGGMGALKGVDIGDVKVMKAGK